MKKISSTLWLSLACGLLPVQVQAQENITVDGTVRNMITYAPEDLPYNPPLVISLHGMSQDANYQRGQTNWEAVADTAKFVVVYPNGINKAWDISGDTDIRFIETIIDTMYSRHHINRNRVYLTGFSMGGMMTYHAMAKMGDKIAAFGPVSGIPVDYRDPSGTRPVPIIHTHGTADNVVWYNGDASHPAGGYGSIPGYVKKWAEFDGCNMTPEVIKPYPANKPGSAATYTRYAGGKDGVEVVLISIEGKGHWHSNDAASVITTQEIWNFCKRYALGPEEPEPPSLVSAQPEDRSFDLPTSTSQFEFVFNEKVDCGQVTAELVGEGEVYSLQAVTEGWNTTLSLSLPEQVEPADGEYVLTIRNVVNEKGGKIASLSFRYTYGFTEVGMDLAIDTLLLPDWMAEQAAVGEGIPQGWWRVNSRSDGSKDEKGPGSVNTGGARLKYFPTGGDFDSGFYLSARDYDVCRFYYGDVEDYRLYLQPGKYLLSFSSIYWSAGSASGKATFDVTVSGVEDGETVFSRSGLSSTGCLNESTAAPVSGAQAHEYAFEVSEAGNYRLEFSMSQGWNSVILGKVKLTTAPSVADVYKGGFLRALQPAQQLYADTEGERYSDSEELREALRKVLEQYEDWSSTSPTEYEAATRAITEAAEPLNVRKACVDRYFTAYEAAKDCVDRYAGNAVYEQQTAYISLREAVDIYAEERMDLSAETQLESASAVLEERLADFLDFVTAVKPAEVVAEPVAVEYYDLDGKRAGLQREGMVIVKARYADGTVRTWKQARKSGR